MNPWKITAIILALALVATLGVSVCHLMESEEEGVLIATTTSLHNTGLLREIAGDYKEGTRVQLKFFPAGTGKALEMARKGGVDMVLVHSPIQEKGFLENDILMMRKIFAYNFFVIVGPSNGPVDMMDKNATEALMAIHNSGDNDPLWVSRGDNSGTHSKEKYLWEKAEYNYTQLYDACKDKWYVNASSGMQETLNYAYEKNCYTLTDTGTYYSWKSSGGEGFEILVKASEELLNVYSAMIVNPGKHGINLEGALKFLRYLISDDCQDTIGDYEKNEEKLFYPVAELLEDGQNGSLIGVAKVGFENEQIYNWITKYAYFKDEATGKITECPTQNRWPDISYRSEETISQK